MFALLFSPLTYKKTQSGQSSNDGGPEGRGGARDFRGLVSSASNSRIRRFFVSVFWGSVLYTNVSYMRNSTVSLQNPRVGNREIHMIYGLTHIYIKEQNSKYQHMAYRSKNLFIYLFTVIYIAHFP